MSRSLRYTNATVLGLKNEAIWQDENGVRHSQCTVCGKYIGSEFDMDYFSLIRRKYCDECRAEVQRKQKAESKKRARKNKRLLNQQNTKLENENQKLRELNARLDSRIDELENRINLLTKGSD